MEKEDEIWQERSCPSFDKYPNFFESIAMHFFGKDEQEEFS